MSNESLWRVSGDAALQNLLDWQECPIVLQQALTGALAWQTRNEVSISRALRSPRVPPQWLAVLLVLGARAVVEGDEGVTVVSLEDILERRVGGKVNALEVPVVTDPARGVVLGAARVSRTPADEPIVAAIAGVQLDGEVVKDARIALTGVWPEAVGLADAAARLVGGRLDDARLGSVAAAVQREVSPPSDYLGSAEYRRAMAGVTTRRALQRCCEQVGGAT